LKLNILASAASSELGSWELEICANTVLDAPFMVINDTMKTRPSENNIVFNTSLKAEDNNNTADELTYTLSSTTSMGTILLNGSELEAGMTFKQSDLDAGNVRYNNLAGTEGLDQFIFTVDDGEGGWTGSHKFIIALDDDFVSSVSDFTTENAFQIFPNPNSGSFAILFSKMMVEASQLSVLNMEGRIVNEQTIPQNTNGIDVGMNHIPAGIYIIKVANSKGIYSERMSVQNR
jgi:hypothetical protein